jgi:hypothetical protein
VPKVLSKVMMFVLIACSNSSLAQDKFQIAVCNAYETAKARENCLAEIGPAEVTPEEMTARRVRAAMRNPGQYIGWSKDEAEAALAGRFNEAGDMEFRDARYSMQVGSENGRVHYVELDFLQHSCRKEVVLDAAALFEEIGSDHEELAPLSLGSYNAIYVSRHYQLSLSCDQPGRPYELFWFVN